MTRTLDNCKVIHYYGKPRQNNGVCAGVVLQGKLHEKCQRCYLHDMRNAIKICIVCGKEFIATNPKARMCSEECKLARKESLRTGKECAIKKHTLDDTLKELEEYNRTHDKYLTYGKYKEMKFLEQLKKNRQRSAINGQGTNIAN